MVLGGGDGSKPSVSFLNFEPKASKFPPTIIGLATSSPKIALIFENSKKIIE